MLSFNEFKLACEKRQGVLNPQYIVTIKTPSRYLKDAEQEGIGINPTLATNVELQKIMFFSSSTVIDKVLNEKVVLKFNVAEPYLQKFYTALQKVDGAEIIEKEQ